MSELNREQIIKALKCCAHRPRCRECPYTIKQCENLRKDALSLIKELTEENERLRLAFVAECDLSNCTREKEIKADTVRKMQERFIAEIEQTPNANEHFIKAWKSKIDQIAKEMLEEGK